MNVISPASNSATNATSVPSAPSAPAVPASSVPAAPAASTASAAPAAATASTDLDAAVNERKASQIKFLNNLGGRTVEDAQKGTFFGYASYQMQQRVPVMGRDGNPKLGRDGNRATKLVKPVIQVPVYIPNDFADQGNNVLTDFAAGSLLNMLDKAAKHKSFKTTLGVKQGIAINVVDVMQHFFDVTSFEDFASVLSSGWIKGKLRESDSLKMALSACGLAEDAAPEVRDFLSNLLPSILEKYLPKAKGDNGKLNSKTEVSKLQKTYKFLTDFESTGGMKGAKPALETFNALIKHLTALQTQFVVALNNAEAALELNHYPDDAARLRDMAKVETFPVRIKSLEHIACAGSKLGTALRKWHIEQLAKATKSGKADTKEVDTTASDDYLMMDL